MNCLMDRIGVPAYQVQKIHFHLEWQAHGKNSTHSLNDVWNIRETLADGPKSVFTMVVIGFLYSGKYFSMLLSDQIRDD
jgi:hypothetical protein